MFSLEVVNEFVEFERSPRRIFHFRVSMWERERRDWGGLGRLRGRSPVLWRHRWGGLPFISNCYGGYHRNSSAPCEERKKRSEGDLIEIKAERPAQPLYLLLYNRLFLSLTVWGIIVCAGYWWIYTSRVYIYIYVYKSWPILQIVMEFTVSSLVL